MRHSVAHQSIVVLGATGATGRHVVSAALRAGHDVVVLVRREGAFEVAPGLREVVWHDLADTHTLTLAMTGADAVISVLGGAAKGPTSVCADGMASTVSAMRTAGVARLVAVSAHGAAESRDLSPFSLAVWAGVPHRMRDKEAMESIATSSGLEWTIVRPPMLTDATATGTYRTSTDLPVRLWSSIARADLAEFLVDELDARRFVRAFPRIVR